MDEIIYPPQNPRPIKPEPLTKRKNVTRKLLRSLLGDKPKVFRNSYGRWDWSLGVLTIRQFCEQLLSTAKSAGIDPDSYYVRAASSVNSIAIEAPIEAETPEKFAQRMEKYELDMIEHRRWEALGRKGQKEMMTKISKLRKAKELQARKDRLKKQLNEINTEISQIEQEIK